MEEKDIKWKEVRVKEDEVVRRQEVEEVRIEEVEEVRREEVEEVRREEVEELRRDKVQKVRSKDEEEGKELRVRSIVDTYSAMKLKANIEMVDEPALAKILLYLMTQAKIYT